VLGTNGLVNDRAIRQLATGGCPEEAGVRGLVWRYLLDLLPPDRRKWPEHLREQRRIYHSFASDLFPANADEAFSNGGTQLLRPAAAATVLTAEFAVEKVYDAAAAHFAASGSTGERSGGETAPPEVSGLPEAASPEAASPEAASPEAASPEAASPEAAPKRPDDDMAPVSAGGSSAGGSSAGGSSAGGSSAGGSSAGASESAASKPTEAAAHPSASSKVGRLASALEAVDALFSDFEAAVDEPVMGEGARRAANNAAARAACAAVPLGGASTGGSLPSVPEAMTASERAEAAAAEDRFLLFEIQKDVVRTHPDLQFFLDVTHGPKRWAGPRTF